MPSGDRGAGRSRDAAIDALSALVFYRQVFGPRPPRLVKEATI